jgi:secreted Zn-dependent insulinase-like peptidase
MSREKFEALKANLIENFNRSPRHINHQAQRMLGVITSGYTDFQMRQSLSEALKRISLQDMLLAYRSLLMDEVLIRKVVH